MAKDKNGVEFAVGQKVKVSAAGPSPWSVHQAGNYSGKVVNLHEDGPYVETKDGVICPLAAECEVV